MWRLPLVVDRLVRSSVGVAVGTDIVVPVVEHDTFAVHRLARVDGASFVATGIRAAPAALRTERVQWHSGLQQRRPPRNQPSTPVKSGPSIRAAGVTPRAVRRRG